MQEVIEFGHERLEAYRVAREFCALAERVCATMARGEAPLRDQLRRASDSVLLNLAEGAGRLAPGEKARFYSIARGSATECAAALDLAGLRRTAPVADLGAARRILHRVVAMLTALARSARARSAERG